MNSISANLNIMIKAAEKASKILIRDFGELEKLQVSAKGPWDFVTNSDKKVEKIIIEELTKSRKKFSILSEEIGEVKNSDKENCWIIDPIDGTTNFLHGIPHFGISIALKSKKEITNSLNTRKSGSAALDLAYVGAGRYDGYFQNNLNIWDIAAGIIIVKEAGGKINDLSYLSNEDIQVFAGSNAIYEKMLENLNNF